MMLNFPTQLQENDIITPTLRRLSLSLSRAANRQQTPKEAETNEAL